MGRVIHLMKFRNVVLGVVFCALACFGAGRAAAQGIVTNYYISVSNSPNTVILGNNVTYTIFLTNALGGALPTAVTNSFPTTANFVSASNTVAGVITNTPGQVVFEWGVSYSACGSYGGAATDHHR